ncbi:MAG: class I SAM-dependent methyltransferase, partial [Acidimicrobiia bacterium]
DYYVNQYRGMERMYLGPLFEKLDDYEPMRVLEIGPGWGTTAAWLADKGHTVTVMDLMPVGTFMTQNLIDEIDVTFVHHDIEDAAWPEGEPEQFDLVVMTQVLPHLAWRPDRALKHVTELMADDAVFVTSVLDRKNYRDLDATFGDDWMDVPEWRTEDRCEDIVKCMYSKRSFRQLLETQFTDIRIWKPARSTVLFATATTR